MNPIDYQALSVFGNQFPYWYDCTEYVASGPFNTIATHLTDSFSEVHSSNNEAHDPIYIWTHSSWPYRFCQCSRLLPNWKSTGKWQRRWKSHHMGSKCWHPDTSNCLSICCPQPFMGSPTFLSIIYWLFGWHPGDLWKFGGTTDAIIYEWTNRPIDWTISQFHPHWYQGPCFCTGCWRV